jgi:hypothetical protein
VAFNVKDNTWFPEIGPNRFQSGTGVQNYSCLKASAKRKSDTLTARRDHANRSESRAHLNGSPAAGGFTVVVVLSAGRLTRLHVIVSTTRLPQNPVSVRRTFSTRAGCIVRKSGEKYGL